MKPKDVQGPKFTQKVLIKLRKLKLRLERLGIFDHLYAYYISILSFDQLQNFDKLDYFYIK